MGSWKRRLGMIFHSSVERSIVRLRRGAFPGWTPVDPLEPRVLLAGTPSQLVFAVQPPQTNAASSPLPTVTVDIEDDNGLLVSNATSKVTISIAAGPPGSTVNGLTGIVSVNAQGGIANFTDLIFTMVGQYTLTATDGTLLQPVSEELTISPAAAQLVFLQPPTSTTAGNPFSPSIVVAVEDASGNVISTDRSNITLSVNSGPGTLTGTTIQSAANQQGMATFNGISLSKAGTYTLKVTDGTLTAAVSAQFGISPTNAAKLVFLQEPTNIPLNGVINPAVTVEVDDQFGNLVTNDTSDVTLSTNGVLNGPTTEAAVGGVATFSGLSVGQLGNYTLTANDDGFTATSTGFAVTGAPAKLAFQRQPAQTMVGTVISPGIVVAVEDINGNVVATDNSAVTLSIAGGPGGTLSGTTTVDAINGVATFPDISLNMVGTYTLNLTDTDSGVTLTNTESVPLVINGPAAGLLFTVEPSGVAAQAAIGPSVVVTVVDAEGNSVLTSDPQVSISLQDITGSGTLTGNPTVTAINGVATFSNLIVSAAGEYTLTANAGTLGNITSISFMVSPSASMLVLASGPTSTAASAIMSPIVIDIEDSNGHLVTTNTSTVTVGIAAGPGNATIGGTTSVVAVKGVATFSNLSLAPGTYSLFFSDVSLATATAAPIIINQPAKKLGFTLEPITTQASSSPNETVVVTIEDKNGNPVMTDQSTVTLTAKNSASTGTLTGTTTAVAVNGVATFTNLVLQTTGSYTFSVTDGSLPAATSNKFSILPAISQETEKLVLTQATTGSTLVATTVAPYVVTVEDQYGNVVTTDNSKITLHVGETGKTFTAQASKGVAKFSGIKFATAQNYTLQFSQAPILANAFQFSQTINPGATFISSNKLPLSLTPGQPLGGTVTFKSNAPTSVPFTGTVTLMVNGTQAEMGTITSAGTVKFANIDDFPQGVSTLTLTYSGDVNHTGTTTTLLENDAAPTTTTLALNPNNHTAAFGSSLTLTATVSESTAEATAPLTGMIVFMDGKTVIGTKAVTDGTVNTATATIGVNGASHGTHSYTAVYESDPAYKNSSTKTPFTVKVTKQGTSTLTLTPSPGTITFGDALTITATLTTSADGTGIHPTGVLHLISGGVDIQDVTLGTTSTATFTVTKALLPGAEITYSGDANFLTASGTLTSLTIDPASTSVNVTPPASVIANKDYKVLVTVDSTNASSVERKGTVILMNGTNSLGTATLVGSFATINVPHAAAPGTYTLTVDYAQPLVGPDIFAPSSESFTLTILG